MFGGRLMLIRRKLTRFQVDSVPDVAPKTTALLNDSLGWSSTSDELVVLAGEIAISGSAEDRTERIAEATDTGSARVRSTNDMAIGCTPPEVLVHHHQGIVFQLVANLANHLQRWFGRPGAAHKCAVPVLLNEVHAFKNTGAADLE